MLATVIISSRYYLLKVRFVENGLESSIDVDEHVLKDDGSDF